MNITCEQFADWKKNNDPEGQARGVNDLLKGNTIVCPKCKHQYSLTRGGCLHFTCTQCKHEFCGGCNQPFYQKNVKCGQNNCSMKGSLHGHHPRNCYYYLRDWDVQQLEDLLTVSSRLVALPSGLMSNFIFRSSLLIPEKQ